MISAAIKNPYVILIAAVAVIGAFSGYTAWVYNKGVQSERMACNNEKEETINENIEIRKEQDAVVRPDDAAYVDILLRGAL